MSYRLALPAPTGEIVVFPSEQLLAGVLVGISIGLFFGLLNGGIACIKHMLLRVFLWRARAMPWNCARFLDYAAERILLRKVGGGYIFVHRLLLEYFASLATSFPEEASVVSAISDPPPATSSTPQIDIGHQEEKTGFNKEKHIATLFVVVLLLLDLAIGSSIFSAVRHSVQNVTDAAATATATQAQANTTAEALANASPVAYPPHNQSPVLNDPLQDNSQGNNWDARERVCKFIHQALDLNATYNLDWCPAKATDFTNFIYEVQMKIVKGDGGGIAFRIDPTSEQQYYSFTITQDGSYSVDATTDGGDAVLAQGSSSAIHRGLNQTNLVAAVVHGQVIELYVNLQRIAVVGSSALTHGQIGVIVTGYPHLTEAIFQNAKVWKL